MIDLIESNLHALRLLVVDRAVMASFDADRVALLFIEVDYSARYDDLRL